MKSDTKAYFLLIISLLLISPYRTQAQATFGPENLIAPLSNSPQSIHTADIDGDGDQDLLVASFEDDKIAWYENDGSGNFGPVKIISTDANGAKSVYSIDLDGDGDNDVLSGSENDDKIAWYENDGSGNFSDEIIISLDANGANSVYSIDLDGDGDNDVLSSSRNDDKIAWYENNGNASFGLQQIISTNADGARSVFSIDLDGDGDKDVLSASYQDNKIAWYENDGSGNFSDEYIISANADGAQSVYSIDLDGDGDNDVLSTSSVDNKIAWYENNGSGNFSDEQIISTNIEFPLALHSIDMDGDGDNDVLSASALDNILVWYENDGNANFGTEQIISTNIDDVWVVYGADIDGDSDNDVISASHSKDIIASYKNDGGGNFNPEEYISLKADEPISVFSIDLDGDGDNDVISASRADDKIAWYENVENGSFETQQIISTEANGANSVYSIDLDGDGDNDVLSTSYEDNKVAWYENDGSGNFSDEIIISTDAYGANSVYSIDLDGDGDNDVLSSSRNDDKIAWYENDGSGGFGLQQIISTNVNKASSVFSIDLDGDGDNDVLSSSFVDDKIAWYENDGNANFSDEIVLSTNADGAESVFSIDLDGDGDNDVLSASKYDDKIAWYENDGNANFSDEIIISVTANGANSVYIIDLNADGHLDAISASSSDFEIAWYENDGDTNFGPEQIISNTAYQVRSVYSIDLDGDEYNDIISTIGEQDKIVWFENLLAFNMTITENNPACIGNNSGSLQLMVSGLTFPPYTYEWILDNGETGSGISETENFIIDGLAEGTYDLMLINAEQDTTIQEGIMLNAIPGNYFEILDITTTNSTNELPNGSIEVTLDSGSPDYTISWSGPNDGSSTFSSLINSITNLYAGNYSLTITDADDNSITQEVTLLDETVPGEICDEPLDVVILNDVSGSVDAVEYEESKQFFVDLINSLNVGLSDDETRVSIIEWSSTNDQTIIEPFTGDTLILQDYVNATRTYSGGTNPNDALTFGYNYLQDEGRPEATGVLVLSTDATFGQASSSLVALSDEYQAEGVVISTIAFDNAYANTITQDILQQVANIDILAPGAPAYSDLDQGLANIIANLYICTSDPGTSNTYYFNRDGAIEINGYMPNESCSDFSSIDIELTVTAQQQLALPAGMPITFYYNNPATFAATPIITSFIPCALAAGESETLTYNLPVSGPANVWAVLNDDGSQSPPINFPITDIEELVWVNNVDQIEVCTDPFPSVSALKYTTTPQPICDTIVMYTIDVCNISSLDAVGVEVEDVAPDGFELLNISINDNGCVLGVEPFDLGVDCCVSLTYEYDASDAAVGLYGDQGVILSGSPEQVYYNFDGSTTSAEDVTVGEVECDSDVVLFTKEVNTTEICEESFVSYTFTIENQTNVALQGLVFTDILADPVIWAAEPYLVEGMSLGVTDITN